MPPRAYVSSVRTAAAAEKRDRVLEAAAKLLREDASIARFSLDTVAKAAGVTRLTVYNQFGSRRDCWKRCSTASRARAGCTRSPTR